MSAVKQHYEALLGEHYAWSVASAGDPFERAASWLARHGLADGARYLDLGAGFGAHAVPLARAGKAVTAVDFHAGLLAALHAAAPTVTTACDDLVAYLAAAPAQRWDTILCLGDTLTHLERFADVAQLIAGAARALQPGGRLALAYRDYSGPPRTGVDRFIPVRHDHDRALVCCLDPLDDARISVTDILTMVTPDGLRTQISSYPKLRLAPAQVAAWAGAAGFGEPRTTVEHGMQLQVFAR